MAKPRSVKAEIFSKRRKGPAKTPSGCRQVPTLQRRREEPPFVGGLEPASRWAGHLPDHSPLHSHQTGGCRCLRLQTGRLRLGEFETVTLRSPGIKRRGRD